MEFDCKIKGTCHIKDITHKNRTQYGANRLITIQNYNLNYVGLKMYTSL